MSRWHHAPLHRLTAGGAYIITAATLHKQKLFESYDALDLLQATLLGKLEEHGWLVQAWAVFPNHYHLVALNPDTAAPIATLAQEVHSITARDLNKMQSAPGRQVWHNYWETHLTYQRSYLARLKYVNHNAVKHGVVKLPENYRWSSARAFQREAPPSLYKTVESFKIDKIKVPDDF